MTRTESNHRPEREILSREGARSLAEQHRDSGQHDPFPGTPFSLLSAKHIKEYVMATGAIAPFYIDGGNRSRLKKASYEGRLGKHAYVYNKQGRLESLGVGDELRVEANSIVFVECDLDFRLPDYIALRFNLQIRHVHRGLLLGTGPLVDPGYWGKLCIPLHNLTDEDYSISRDDGLIWVEFTKTTEAHRGSGDLGRPPLDKREGYWEIREFIDRAARPRNGIGESVHIRSSISKVIDRAESASSSAEQAERSATDAKNQASRMSKNITLGGIISGLVLVIGIATFIYTVYSSLTSRIDDLQNRLSYIESASTDKELKSLPSVTRELEKEIETLHRRVEKLEISSTDEQKAVR